MITLAYINLNYILVPAIIAVCIAAYFLAQKNKSRTREKVMAGFRSATFTNEDDLSWYVAHDVMGKAGYPDCVVYKVDPADKVCRQIAAFGPKNPEKMSILNPINIPFGRGIVGHVAASGKAERIDDTTKDDRYVPDDDVRYSELTVPVLVNGSVAMVIDSEHKNPSWFKETDLQFVSEVAGITAGKLQGMRR